MAGLPRAIIKKYGVSKKAWAVYRATKRNSTRRTVTRARGTTMARRKVKRSRSSFRRSARRSSSGGGNGIMSIALPAAIYGAVRAPAARFATPMVSGILPASAAPYANNIALGVASWAAMKYGSGQVRNVGRAGLTVEIANASSTLTSGFTGTNSGNSSVAW